MGKSNPSDRIIGPVKCGECNVKCTRQLLPTKERKKQSTIQWVGVEYAIDFVQVKCGVNQSSERVEYQIIFAGRT